jgi:iron complex outermembrane receptor protein
MIKHFYIKAILITLSISSAASAEQISMKENLNQVFNPQIFSLSKRKENAFDAPSATYVLSSEEIRRSGATSIPEALRLVPGVQVARIDGNKWAITIRGFNRQFSNKLLILIDGRTVFNPLFSGVAWDLHDYILADIDRIEVVRGPGGTIWGANAVNGVINIITKSASQTQGYYASQIVGNQDKSITEIRYGGETEKGDSYRLYGKKTMRNGVDNYATKNEKRDNLFQDRAGFKYDISSVKGSKISVTGDVYDGVSENYFSTLESKNDANAEGANLVVNWDKKISNKSSFILNSYLDYDQFEMPVLKRSAYTLDIDFQHFYSFSKDNQFTWGFGYRQIRDDMDFSPDNNGITPLSYTNEARDDQLVTGFIQDKFALISDELYLTIGSKFEHNDFTGFEYQPNARLAYYPDRKQTIWAAVSRAVRTPTRAENDVTIRAAPNSNLVLNQGSPGYEAEVLTAYEFGYKYKPTVDILLDATTFYNSYRKLRTFEPVGPNGTIPTAANLGHGESYGLEFTGKWQVNHDWRLEGSYEYLKMNLGLSPASNDNRSILSSVDNLENAEGQSPASQFRLKSFYNITSKLEFDNILYYVGRLKKGVNNNQGLPSYVRMDTRLGYFFTKNLDLSLGVQNLFDQRHTEFKQGLYNTRAELGRTYYAKLVWQY